MWVKHVVKVGELHTTLCRDNSASLRSNHPYLSLDKQHKANRSPIPNQWLKGSSTMNIFSPSPPTAHLEVTVNRFSLVAFSFSFF